MSSKTFNAKTYNVLPGHKMGVITPENLEQVAALAKKHKVPFLKLTGAQRIAIAGHSPDDANDIWHEMGQKSGPQKPIGIHYIQAFPGEKWCKYGKRDSIALGKKIEESLFNIPLPAKTKVGISGCALNCCECYIRDIGIFAKKKGWSLVFDGNGGGSPRIGDVIEEGLSDDDVIELTRKCLNYYVNHARRLERTARVMRRRSVNEMMEFIKNC